MNWFNKSRVNTPSLPEMTDSILYDEKTFYKKFTQDLLKAKEEVIIESPFVASNRTEILVPVFQQLLKRGIKVYILTKDPIEYEDEYFRHQATNEILSCVDMGINVVLINNNHHRKIAIIDRSILWEGSLNILSQSHSLEIMRRIESKNLTEKLFRFLKFDKLSIFGK